MFKKIKWFFQTLFRGYSDYDMNDYGRFACRKILPSLKHWVYKNRLAPLRSGNTYYMK